MTTARRLLVLLLPIALAAWWIDREARERVLEADPLVARYQARVDDHRALFLRDLVLLAQSPLLADFDARSDAGPVLNRALGWFPTALQIQYRDRRHLPPQPELSLPQDIAQRLFEWRDDAVIEGTALGMPDLSGFDLWDTTVDSPISDAAPAQLGALPWPDYWGILLLGRLQIATGRDLHAALAQHRAAARLALRSGQLLGVMTAAKALAWERRVATADWPVQSATFVEALSRAASGLGVYVSFWSTTAQLEEILSIAPQPLGCAALAEFTETAARLRALMAAGAPDHYAWLTARWRTHACPANGIAKLWLSEENLNVPPVPYDSIIDQWWLGRERDRQQGEWDCVRMSTQAGFLRGYDLELDGDGGR